MIRFMMGLSFACLLVGCGDAMTDAPVDAANDAPAPAATEMSETPAGDTDVAAMEKPAMDDSAPAEMMTVKFKVPGMT